jgi:uncharacterized protein (TIGR04255 family)
MKPPKIAANQPPRITTPTPTCSPSKLTRLPSKRRASQIAIVIGRTMRSPNAKAPLIQVVSELRFPPILKIASEPPADFQERIRATFPLFATVPNLALPQLQQMPALQTEILQVIGPQLGGTSHQFQSEDHKATITLTISSFSLTTTDYRTWEDFRNQLNGPLRALEDVCKPTFFSRIGLRYIDAISRQMLGLDNRLWSSLLKDPILGELAVPVFEQNAEVAERQLTIRIPDGSGKITLRHGHARIQEKPDICYVIDFDFFRDQRTEVKDAGAALDRFNKLAGNAFRWCITTELHDALDPQPIGDIGRR